MVRCIGSDRWAMLLDVDAWMCTCPFNGHEVERKACIDTYIDGMKRMNDKNHPIQILRNLPLRIMDRTYGFLNWESGCFWDGTRITKHLMIFEDGILSSQQIKNI